MRREECSHLIVVAQGLWAHVVVIVWWPCGHVVMVVRAWLSLRSSSGHAWTSSGGGNVHTLLLWCGGPKRVSSLYRYSDPCGRHVGALCMCGCRQVVALCMRRHCQEQRLWVHVVVTQGAAPHFHPCVQVCPCRCHAGVLWNPCVQQ